MALSLARSPHPAAALPAPRASQFAPPLPPLRSPRRQHHRARLRLRFPGAAAVAASSPPEAQAPPAAAEQQQQGEKRRKLYVANLPWSLPAPEVEKLFAQCGTVKDVELIKGKDGRNRGFAFVTMSTAEAAAAAVEKLNSHDVMGRSIKVEFSKSFRKPAPPPPPGTIIERHKLYVSNLPWKARAPDVKEFFSKFNPLSANIIFDNGKAAGYGFVSFGTKEEAEAALSELDGKELMGRPVLLQWKESGDDKDEVVKADGEVETAEGASVDDASDDGGEDKQE
ncbi:28 kDa ribonucleoprotein, chloroplastic [Panicum miliaceum]|uniref:28 kDa ribonucleoprotein, chloroplastic n=1 Tax=Panicum miliaceum TaxID=4540 RepID=A0A3L6Q378_PANMI|nr:28 kDa ribonucleoprotein, chloroplastic [Panicum miliaceum]